MRGKGTNFCSSSRDQTSYPLRARQFARKISHQPNKNLRPFFCIFHIPFYALSGYKVCGATPRPQKHGSNHAAHRPSHSVTQKVNLSQLWRFLIHQPWLQSLVARVNYYNQSSTVHGIKIFFLNVMLKLLYRIWDDFNEEQEIWWCCHSPDLKDRGKILCFCLGFWYKMFLQPIVTAHWSLEKNA